MAEGNTIFIGRKNVMSYVLAIVTQFNNSAKEVHIRARGNLISRAVDVAEIARSKFVQGAKVRGISISTDDVPCEDGSVSKVSAIEIILEKL